MNTRDPRALDQRIRPHVVDAVQMVGVLMRIDDAIKARDIQPPAFAP
jgi:hypothetical protein